MFRISDSELGVGDKVRLGNGEQAVIRRKGVGPTGFTFYSVEMTSGARAGEHVAATPSGMQRLAHRAVVASVGRHQFTCRVARTPAEHSQGLQGVDALGANEGLLFVFDPPRATTFHMGKVAFPIDIVFGHAGHVTKVVHNVQPGDVRRFAAAPVDTVLEVAGGTCQKLGISPPLSQDHYTVALPHEITDEPNRRDPTERYPAGTPDESSPLANQMSNKHWQSTTGYDPTRPDYAEGDGPGLRMSAVHVDNPEDLVAEVIKRMSTDSRPIDWHRDALNPHLSSAVLTARDLEQWSPVKPDEHVLQLIGDGLVSAGVAVETEVKRHEGQDVLVLWARRE